MKAKAPSHNSKKRLKLNLRKFKFIKSDFPYQPKLKPQALEVLAALMEEDKTTINFIIDYQILGIAARISELRKFYSIRTNRLSSGIALYHLEGKINE